jgi:hypothetical protein
MFKTGKLPKKSDYRTLRLKKYMTAAISPPLDYFSTVSNISATLSNYNLDSLFPMDYNDKYGDCVMAGAAHTRTANDGMIGKTVIPAGEEVLKQYLTLTGGQDTGLNMLDTLKVWKNTGLFGEKILGFAAIMDPTDHVLVKQAMSLFGVLYLGFQCQEKVLDDFQAGVTWTPGTLTNDGHCVVMDEYDPNTVSVMTWGKARQKGTWAWWDACVDEVYVVLPPEAQDPGFAPGFDIALLTSDLAVVGNTNP